MSYDSRSFVVESHHKDNDSRSFVVESHHGDNDSVVTTRHRDTHSESGGQFISSVVINLRQLKTDLHAQHQHDKATLTELNRHFQEFVDRVQHLQSQNSKYLAAIADFRRKSAGINIIDVRWDEGYLGIKRDLSAIENSKVDYEWDYELCHLQIAIYRQLIEIDQQWEGKRTLILEDELKQSASVLHGLRSSYGEMQRKVQGLYLECDDLFKHYLTLSHDWCVVKKQRHKWHLNLDATKSYIAFYKNLRSYIGHDFTSVQSDNVIHVQALDLGKIIKKIRYDFEVFYATIYRQMTASYEAKMTEIEIDVKEELRHQSIQMEEFAMVLRTLQAEYEKVHMNLSHEKEMLLKLEHTNSKLEAELNSIQLHHEERYEVQSKELNHVQENIMYLVYDVDEMRRSKADLEAEIIVYRHLLEIYEIEHRVTVIPETQAYGSETMGKLVVKSQKKGSIGIKECAPNGTYISLVNYSTNKDIDISGWKLKRHIDSVTKLRYRIPDGIRLKRDSELRIYAQSGGGTTSGSSSYHKLVNNDLTSWGMGTTIETILFNKNGDEEASYLQSIQFG